MPKSQALCKLDSGTIQLYWSYRDRTNLEKVTTRKVYLCVWYAVCDCAIVTALRLTWSAYLVNGTKSHAEWSGVMKAGLTYFPTVLVLSRSGLPGQSYDAKSVPLCLVHSVRLCHSYSDKCNLVAA
jgi:hypothetical protein